MKINIASVLRNDGASKEFSGEAELGSFEYMGSTLTFENPPRITGRIHNIGGTLEISGQITGEYTTVCSRCQAPIRKVFSAELFESIDDELSDIDEECITVSGNVIDISGSIDACIFGSLPMQPLCREDCKGLCHQCGTDLNKNECNCEDEVYDPRFAIFRKLSKEV